MTTPDPQTRIDEARRALLDYLPTWDDARESKSLELIQELVDALLAPAPIPEGQP